MKRGGVIEYRDPINDDFSGYAPRRQLKIDRNFPFLRRGSFYRLGAFFVYRVVMKPFAFLFSKIRFGVRFIGKEKLKATKGQGFYLYGNHTMTPDDAFIPNILCYSRRLYFVVHPDNIAARGTRTVMQMLGAIPTPNHFSGYAPFSDALATRLSEKAGIVIYPEAHIWPYYTGIRPFSDAPFRYPAKDGLPVFSLTVTYRRRVFGRPGMTVYVDGPFTSEGDSVRERTAFLHHAVYESMVRRTSSPDNIAFVTYRMTREKADSSEQVPDAPCPQNE